MISKSTIVLLLSAFLAFYIAATQPFGYSPDYDQYEDFFHQLRIDFLSQIMESRFEPGFLYLSAILVNALESDVLVYALLVIFSILIKLTYVKKFSKRDFYYLSITYYFFRLFPLHELTQLRASLALSFIITACYHIWKNNKIFAGSISCGIATIFHYSSLMLFPLIFIRNISKNYTLYFSIFIYIFVYFFAQYLVDYLGQSLIVFKMYEIGGFANSTSNFFSLALVPEIILLSLSFLYWDDLTDIMRRIATIELIGFALYFALIDFPVIAMRGRDFYSVLWIIFIAEGQDCKSNIRFYIFIFVLLSIFVGIYLYFINKFFR